MELGRDVYWLAFSANQSSSVKGGILSVQYSPMLLPILGGWQQCIHINFLSPLAVTWVCPLDRRLRRKDETTMRTWPLCEVTVCNCLRRSLPFYLTLWGFSRCW